MLAKLLFDREWEFLLAKENEIRKRASLIPSKLI